MPRHYTTRSASITLTCETCGVQKQIPARRAAARFCGHRCRAVTMSKHGDARSGRHAPEYDAWVAMRSRCRNPSHVEYRNYGGRGITVCPEWDSYANFIRDMGRRPSPGFSIDRINNDLGYEPSNCRWATGREQLLNTRRTVWITAGGVTRTRIEWAEVTGISYDAIEARQRLGWPPERVVGLEP